MKVYQPGARGKCNVYVCPGKLFPIRDWLDKDKKPLQIKVQFVDGVADVEERLGNYMILQKIATDSPIILLS